jgi:FSR family fosmidomycin resistance protein-like MFS transporter
LIFAASAASSIVQPIFGHFADRLSKPWLMPAGLALAGICMSLVGLMPNYAAMVLIVAMCGLGVAAFHPEGARLVNLVAGERKATAMSFFSIGGNMGFAVGPVLMAGAVLLCGLHGTLLLAIPSLGMAVFLLIWQQGFHVTSALVPGHAAAAAPESKRDAWGAFAGLSFAVVVRSMFFYALLTFLPLYWVHILHKSEGAGGVALTLFITSGLCGTFLGGRLADRFGYLTVMRVGFVLLVPLLFLFVRLTHVPSAMAFLIPFGMIYYAPFSAMVVLGQRYLPNRLGLASGVTLGLAVSIGGAMTPVLGKLADQHGIIRMLTWVGFLPIVVLLSALLLPEPSGPGGKKNVPTPVPEGVEV